VHDPAGRRIERIATVHGATITPRLPLTDDPDLHLLVNGQRLNPTLRVDDQYLFRLSAAPNTVRIVSRAAIPQDMPGSRW
jgi:hypothetical protein